ncbi:MAG: domain containing protein, partial [Solirubrobacterales bacterium]|nr:domain containing protein [Solirubrobacterales bacterium]
GSGTLVNQRISKGKVAWDMFAGETTFSGTTLLKQGNIELAATIPPSRIGADAFELNGHGQLKMKTFFGDWQSDAQFLMTEVGTVGCVGRPGSRFGLGYRWGQTFKTFAGNCDIGKWKQSNKGSARAAQAGAAASFDLPANLPVAAVEVHGAGAAPKVALTGPDGTKIVAPVSGASLQGATATIIPAADEPVTYVILVRPKGGRWTVSSSDGAPITSLRTADGLPQPQVTGKLVKTGRSLQLRYKVKPLSGQQVRFVEIGRGASKQLGVAKGTAGTLRFRPAAGPGGRRSIIAQVVQGGLPRAAITLARYTAPAPPKLAAPKSLRLRRSGSRLLASWKPVRGAARYSVTVKLTDGRSVPLETRRPALTVKSVAAATKGTVAVVAIGADGRVSKPVTARLGVR